MRRIRPESVDCYPTFTKTRNSCQGINPRKQFFEGTLYGGPIVRFVISLKISRSAFCQRHPQPWKQ